MFLLLQYAAIRRVQFSPLLPSANKQPRTGPECVGTSFFSTFIAPAKTSTPD